MWLRKLRKAKVILRVEKCEGFNEEELERLLVESKETLVGETGLLMMDIVPEPDTKVISQWPYLILEKNKEGVGLVRESRCKTK